MSYFWTLWRCSWTGRLLTVIMEAAQRSTTSQILSRLGSFLKQQGRASALLKTLQLDWGAKRLLAGSEFAGQLSKITTAAEKAGVAVFARGKEAWPVSLAGQTARRLQEGREQLSYFAGALLIGLAAGTIFFGHLGGILTKRRLLASLTIMPLGMALLCLEPAFFRSLAVNSLFIQVIVSLVDRHGVGRS